MRNLFIAGHRGMVGSAVWRALSTNEDWNLIGISRNFLDLRNESEVLKYFEINEIDVVIDAAAIVGGIHANFTYPYPFLMDNLRIQNSLINASVLTGVKTFIFLGSSCIYPAMAKQPIKEEYLLSGPLESTNEFYAVAKISGVKAIEAARKQYGFNYFSLMPTNIYGPGDNFDLKTSHVLPAMIRKFHEAKFSGGVVELWGNGSAYREFLHVDDLASAIVFLLNNPPKESIFNVGTGVDLTIRELSEIISNIVEYEGQIFWDDKKLVGTLKKQLDISKILDLGWEPKIALSVGIRDTYDWFRNNLSILRNVSIN